MTGRPPTLSDVLGVLQAIRVKAGAHGVELIGVAGSVARQQAGPQSDVDVVYRVSGHPTLFTLGDLQMDLQDALGSPVDLIDLALVKPRLRAEIERDLVRV